jgi:NIMA (never in mitosis gene a)-related kinase
LNALHEKKILHRDLKSANVFLGKNGRTMLGDMNVSKVAKKGLLYTQTGTPYYASPEVWRDQPYNNKSDIWSLGCVLYEMTTLKPPFRAQDMNGLYKRVLKGQYPPISHKFSKELSQIIAKLLTVDAKARPSTKEILRMEIIKKKAVELEQTNEHFEANDTFASLQDTDANSDPLLKTIRVPNNLTNLTSRLPKSNYSKLRERDGDSSVRQK